MPSVEGIIGVYRTKIVVSGLRVPGSPLGLPLGLVSFVRLMKNVVSGLF